MICPTPTSAVPIKKFNSGFAWSIYGDPFVEVLVLAFGATNTDRISGNGVISG
jgi:hypothetical protein